MKIKIHKNKLTKEKVIEQFINKHGNKYDYSKINYLGDSVKIAIICPIHGEFEQTPSNHKRGQNCGKCVGNGLSVDEIKKEFINKHGNKYDYSKINYSDIKTKITIICPTHGEFEQTPNNHKRGQGCKKCYGNDILEHDTVINNFVIKHGDKYDYSKMIYVNAHTKIIIVCPTHGEFKQTPNNHKIGHACPTCNESKGETKIRLFLNENNIKFTPQHKFQDCKNILELPFDFYLPDYNMCIEYNGIQHYKPVKHFGGDSGFEKRLKNDIIKKEYCEKHNIPLIIIKYNENPLNKLLGLVFKSCEPHNTTLI